ncbi:MAG: hypothetical protein QOG99_2046 [Frankiales bacterium]|nr:hypothetical protein [Frankiales bacterium]
MRRTATFVLTGCLALTGCSGSSGTSSAPTTSPTPSATTDPLFPISSAYVVAAGKGVDHKKLTQSLSALAALPGVQAASVTGALTLEVQLTFTITQSQRDAVLAKLRSLGTVGVPPKK